MTSQEGLLLELEDRILLLTPRMVRERIAELQRQLTMWKVVLQGLESVNGGELDPPAPRQKLPQVKIDHPTKLIPIADTSTTLTARQKQLRETRDRKAAESKTPKFSQLDQVVEYLQKNGPTTVAQLAVALQIPKPSVYAVISNNSYIFKKMEGANRVMGKSAKWDLVKTNQVTHREETNGEYDAEHQSV